MRPPRETVTVVLPRPLVYRIRAQYEPAVADDLLRMLGCAQQEQAIMRLAGWPSMALGLLLVASLLGLVHPWSPLGFALFALCCAAIGRFGSCAARYGQWRTGIWNANPDNWKAIADELQPVEEECLKRGGPKEKLAIRL